MPSRTAHSLRGIETGIGQKPVLKAEHDHQSQSNEKRRHGVEDDQHRCRQLVGKRIFFVSAPKSPEKTDPCRKQHRRDSNLQRIADFLTDERRDSGVLFI